MIITKIETGLTTEDDQTNINTTGTNQRQIIFEYTDQNLYEMLKMVRYFINFMKTNLTTREQFKANKIATCREYDNKVNESDIHSSSLDQVQQLTNKDKDIVFDALVAADYINEIECTDSSDHQQA